MSDNILFANNASALLAATISAVDTTIQLATGFGANFPSPTGSQVFYATLEDDDGDIEVVQVTARSGDNLTVVRAQDGTTAQAFTLNVTRVELRLTKVVMEEFLQKNGGTMTGNIDLDGNNLVDAVLTGASTSIQAGEAVVPLRGDIGETGNQLVVPSGGSAKPTVGGVDIVLEDDDLTTVFAVGGVLTLDPATRLLLDTTVRVVDSGGTDYLDMSHDGTDFNFAFTNTAEVNWDAILNMTANLEMNDNVIIGAELQDFSIDVQAVTATATTALDYSSGSYVDLDLDTSITTFSITNPPATGKVGTMRLKITMNAGSETIDWTDLPVKWTGGTAPTLSGAGAIFFVDLWTDDGGTTWYGSYGADAWS